MDFINYDNGYDSFYNTFKKLSIVEENIVLNMLQYMEHNFNPKDIDIKRGIDVARYEQEITEEELISAITLTAKRSFEISGDYDAKSSYKSMLKRNSMKSKLFPIVLELLHINKKYIIQQSDFYQRKMIDLEWLYNSLSADNKNAICFLVYGLLNKIDFAESYEYFSDLHKIDNSIGVVGDF